MQFEYKVKNIGTTKEYRHMEKELNTIGSDSWELINFKVNEDKTLTGIFKKQIYIYIYIYF